MFNKDGLIKFSTSPHSPHVIVPQLIESKSAVLDVGCNSGTLGKILTIKNCAVDGIDINPKLLKKAKKYYHHTYLHDLSQPKLNIPTNLKYNYIVLMDILEHLPRPDLVLISLKKHLKPNGKIIVSLPNIARVEIRFQLLLGRFNYSGGIMGPDHLRFFTKHSAINMFHQCQLKILKIIPTGLGHMIKILPNLTAFQFIYILQND